MVVPPFLRSFRHWLQHSENPAIVCLYKNECGAFSEEFEDALIMLQTVLETGDGNRIVIAETDPIKGLVLLFAAMAHEAAVFLCNPQWGDREWQQVHQHIQPHHYLGNAVPQVTSPLDTPHPLLAKRSPTQIAIPTGGTSGTLKFASHTWSSLYRSAQGFQQHFTPDATARRAIHSFCCLPLFHVSGLMQVVRAIVSHGSVTLGHSKNFLAGGLLRSPPPRHVCVPCPHPTAPRPRVGPC